jgi:DNA-binding beta-propeller fold protein YncE
MPVLAAGALSCRRKRGDGFNGYAFVANQEGRAIAAVDLTAFAVARHIALDGAPTEVIAHPSQPLVYALTPDTGTVYEIETGSLSVKRKVWLGGPATSMLREPGDDPQCLWILSGPGKRLLRLPFDSLRVSADIRLPVHPTSFDLGAAHNGKEWVGMAVAGYGPSGSLSLIDLRTGTVQKPVPVGGEIGTVRFRTDGKSVLVAGLEARQLTVIDTQTGGVVVHLPLALRPDHFCFHPDGGQLFVTGEGRDAVVVVYPYFVPEVAETVLAGSRPGAMAATRSHLFVTSPGAGDVSIMNITRRRVIAVTAVGTGPGFVVVTPDNEYALVLNRESGDMAVIRVAGLQPDRRKTAPLFTMIPVGSKPVSAVVASV